MEQVPDEPPRLDLMVDEEYDGEGVEVVFYNRDTEKHTRRHYTDMNTARKMAAFIALTLDVGKGEKLNKWLEERNFEPFSETHIQVANSIQEKMKEDAASHTIQTISEDE